MKAKAKSVGSVVQSSHDEVIARAVKRGLQNKAAAAAKAKNANRAAASRKKPQLDNDDLHMQNASDRQADGVEDIGRDSESVASYKPPSNLDAPAPRPGFTQKWVRFKTGKDEDTDNLSKAIESGWSPRERTTIKRGHPLTTSSDSKYGLYIVKRGLILCEMPEAKADARARYYDKQQRRMTESIDRSLFKENNRVMPVLNPERRTSTTTKARRGRLEAQIED